jgi:hypothetical protein
MLMPRTDVVRNKSRSCFRPQQLRNSAVASAELRTDPISEICRYNPRSQIATQWDLTPAIPDFFDRSLRPAVRLHFRSNGPDRILTSTSACLHPTATMTLLAIFRPAQRPHLSSPPQAPAAMLPHDVAPRSALLKRGIHQHTSGSIDAGFSMPLSWNRSSRPTGYRLASRRRTLHQRASRRPFQQNPVKTPHGPIRRRYQRFRREVPRGSRASSGSQTVAMQGQLRIAGAYVGGQMLTLLPPTRPPRERGKPSPRRLALAGPLPHVQSQDFDGIDEVVIWRRQDSKFPHIHDSEFTFLCQSASHNLAPICRPPTQEARPPELSSGEIAVALPVADTFCSRSLGTQAPSPSSLGSAFQYKPCDPPRA